MAVGTTTNPSQRMERAKLRTRIQRVNTNREPMADPKLPAKDKNHRKSVNALIANLMSRAAMFTCVNETVSCSSDKRLQNWPTVYTNLST